ncbi:hypothetical protein [Leifsonia poae]|uniref:hypothetical protein n=1 Tax=Leifsonia poae TaxID=110933 RepID=UPI001CBE2B19|nr:hypothetical protein [Leifsonia poae]
MMLSRITVTVVAAALFLGGGATTAAAATSDVASSSTRAALDGHGLLSASGAEPRSAVAPTSAASGSGTVSPEGLIVDSGNGNTVGISPATSTRGTTEAGGGAAVFDVDPSYSYAVTGKGTAANAGYAVIKDSSAPSTYQFVVTVNGVPAKLTLADRGAVVQDADGQAVNFIGAAWAKDVSGAVLSTSYSVDGNVLTQHVDHRGAAYPIVADPGLECDWQFCTILLSRGETKQMATSMAAAAAIIAAACGPAAWACGIGTGLMVDTANRAMNQGKCAGIRKQHILAPVWPIIEPCRS